MGLPPPPLALGDRVRVLSPFVANVIGASCAIVVRLDLECSDGMTHRVQGEEGSASWCRREDIERTPTVAEVIRAEQEYWSKQPFSPHRSGALEVLSRLDTGLRVAGAL